MEKVAKVVAVGTGQCNGFGNQVSGRRRAPSPTRTIIGAEMDAELRSHYRELDLEPGASLAEVKEAYRDLAFVFHPDRNQSNERRKEKALAKMKRINAASNAIERHLRSPGAATKSSGRTKANSGDGRRGRGRTRQARERPESESRREPNRGEEEREERRRGRSARAEMAQIIDQLEGRYRGSLAARLRELAGLVESAKPEDGLPLKALWSELLAWHQREGLHLDDGVLGSFQRLMKLAAELGFEEGTGRPTQRRASSQGTSRKPSEPRGTEAEPPFSAASSASPSGSSAGRCPDCGTARKRAPESGGNGGLALAVLLGGWALSPLFPPMLFGAPILAGLAYQGGGNASANDRPACVVCASNKASGFGRRAPPAADRRRPSPAEQGEGVGSSLAGAAQSLPGADAKFTSAVAHDSGASSSVPSRSGAISLVEGLRGVYQSATKRWAAFARRRRLAASTQETSARPRRDPEADAQFLALNIRCPTCGADPGTECSEPKDDARSSHPARIAALHGGPWVSP